MMLIKGSTCTNCGEFCDAATQVGGDASPSTGDCTVCLYCGHLMIYSEDLSLRNPNDQELMQLAGNKSIIQAQQIGANFRKMKTDERK